MAWTWADSRGSTNQYKVVHACNGVLGVCLDTWAYRYIYGCLSVCTFVCGTRLGGLFPALTSQTHTGIGFYACWCCVSRLLGRPVGRYCQGVLTGTTGTGFCTPLYQFFSLTLYQFVPFCTTQTYIYIGLYMSGTNQYKPVQAHSNAVVQRYTP